jgi:hypothetical protein
VLASRSGRHLDQALRFARLLHPDHLETWHVEEPGDLRLLAQWNQRHADTPLRFIEAGPDGVAATLRREVRRVRNVHPDDLLTVVVAEEVRARAWWHLLAHRNGGPSILRALRQESGVAVTDLNYFPMRRGGYRPGRSSPLMLVSKRLVRMAGTSLDFGRERAGIVRRVEAIVLVSEVTAPTLRALQYACAVCPGAVRALHVEIEPEQRSRVEAAWAQQQVTVPLEVVESPYRDLTAMVMDYLERAARRAGGNTLLNVVIPEFVVTSAVGKLLHNQSALWIRAALYAHPRVAVTSVPWVLESAPADGPAPAG